jgi:hypothetical protein
MRQSAEWLGDSDEDNRGLVLVLGALVHGTAMNTITGVISKENVVELNAAFRKAVDVLIANRKQLRAQ